jgi:hypothetical protein
VNPAGDQLWDQGLAFAVADQRVAADQGEVQWLDPIDEFEDPVYEFLAFAICQSAQRDSAA